MPVLLINRCSPACDGGHEGRIAAGVLRRQQRLQVRPEDGAVANQLKRGQRGCAAAVRLGQGIRLRSLVRFGTCNVSVGEDDNEENELKGIAWTRILELS